MVHYPKVSARASGTVRLKQGPQPCIIDFWGQITLCYGVGWRREEAVLCIAGSLAASLVSTHSMSVAHFPKVTTKNVLRDC